MTWHNYSKRSWKYNCAFPVQEHCKNSVNFINKSEQIKKNTQQMWHTVAFLLSFVSITHYLYILFITRKFALCYYIKIKRFISFEKLVSKTFFLNTTLAIKKRKLTQHWIFKVCDSSPKHINKHSLVISYLCLSKML